MPRTLRDFECPCCHVVTEDLVNLETEPLPTCQACSVEMKPVLSAPRAFHFKGAVDTGLKFKTKDGARVEVGPLREYKNGKLGDKI